MRLPITLVAAALLVFALPGVRVTASGPMGVYAVVERVVFEPKHGPAERVQIYGAFAYVDGAGEGPTGAVSLPRCGYLYLRLLDSSSGLNTPATIAASRTEWNDIESVAGTGQAIGFGRWGYIGGFDALDPAKPTPLWDYGLHVRQANESPDAPAPYYPTTTGVVKLPSPGSHAWIVSMLRGSLRPDSGCKR
jgi:hypothetical protein